ncbi:MAG TPA: A/G-specific adenine glycosylase [Burkholderiales bacterium]|nr:A/G-specific adenine glycosylase [Burkholderiales bacterium]
MAFAEKLIRWQRRHGRRNLPWQGTRDPYRIWLSEVMLQQTQVSAVIPYYERFLRRFPTVAELAAASEEEVLELWSGLGYYARGRNLHRAARQMAATGFPRTAEALAELAGVGRSTAAAIAAFAYGERGAILDGNVKRVLARAFAVSDAKALWPLAERLLPKRGIETYTQALMDLGATVCTRLNPRCERCPVSDACKARKQKRIAELPAPRARRELPQREVTWLVLRHDDAVLVERRPSPGIWGGLWCPPEFAGRKPAGAKALAPIEHGFTHYRLRIKPLLCDVQERKAGRWLRLEDAGAAALPAPVKALLARLREGAQ